MIKTRGKELNEQNEFGLTLRKKSGKALFKYHIR